MAAEPLDRTLYERVKREAKKRFKRWPSAYASGWLVQEYKRRGGRYAKASKKITGIERWFAEKWINVCELPKRVPCARPKRAPYPYCRPMIRISAKTPRIASSLSKAEIENLCRKKRKIGRKVMKRLPRSRSASRRRSVSASKIVAKLTRSSNPEKKFKVVVTKHGKKCTIHFGGAGYSDYTIHKDPKRKKRYLQRHRARENWSRSGICTAGFWSRWLLWGETTISASKREIARRFKIRFS